MGKPKQVVLPISIGVLIYDVLFFGTGLCLNKLVSYYLIVKVPVGIEKRIFAV